MDESGGAGGAAYGSFGPGDPPVGPVSADLALRTLVNALLGAARLQVVVDPVLFELSRDWMMRFATVNDGNNADAILKDGRGLLFQDADLILSMRKMREMGVGSAGFEIREPRKGVIELWLNPNATPAARGRGARGRGMMGKGSAAPRSARKSFKAGSKSANTKAELAALYDRPQFAMSLERALVARPVDSGFAKLAYGVSRTNTVGVARQQVPEAPTLKGLLAAHREGVMPTEAPPKEAAIAADLTALAAAAGLRPEMLHADLPQPNGVTNGPIGSGSRSGSGSGSKGASGRPRLALQLARLLFDTHAVAKREGVLDLPPALQLIWPGRPEDATAHIDDGARFPDPDFDDPMGSAYEAMEIVDAAIVGQTGDDNELLTAAYELWKGFESYPQGLGAAVYQALALSGAFTESHQRHARIRHEIVMKALDVAIEEWDLALEILGEYFQRNPERVVGRAVGGLLVSRYLRRMPLPKNIEEHVRVPLNILMLVSVPVAAGYGSAVLLVAKGERDWTNLLQGVAGGKPDYSIIKISKNNKKTAEEYEDFSDAKMKLIKSIQRFSSDIYK